MMSRRAPASRVNHLIVLLIFSGSLLSLWACGKKTGSSDAAASSPGPRAAQGKETPAPRDKFWYRAEVGGDWDEIGKLQFEYLVKQGLKKDHYLLDVGCGSLRGGIHFARYLERGHYYGIDIDRDLLEAGRAELKANNLADRDVALVEMGDFSFERLNRKFDYALAQSVFTHLPLNSIIRCLMNMDKALAPGGRFYATFFENPKGKNFLGPLSWPRADGPPQTSYFDKDPYHYDVETFRWICVGTSLAVERLGDWGHPRRQRMLLFTKR